MKLPRDIGGVELTGLLVRYGYTITRQRGSHIRLTSVYMGYEHHITIPHHNHLKPGTLSGKIRDVAAYLEMDSLELSQSLFA